MRRSLVKLGGLVVALMCTSVAAGAVNASSSSVIPSKKLAAVTLRGDGSTFQLNYTQAIISAFKQRQPLVTVNYEGIGSTRGLDDFANQRVDFAGTDIPFTPESAAAAKGGAFFYFPIVVAPVAVAYNIPGVSNLQLSPDTVAEIFQGEIKTWDALVIKQENPDLSLPNIPISIAHRADGSGTTQNFTRFLTEAAPATWALGTGATVQWPVDSQGGAGDVGVAQIVKTTDGAIGYVDYADAHALALSSASIKNATGKYVAASPESATAALVGVLVNPDLTFDPINSADPDAYPITAPTWLVVYRCQADPRKAAALKAILRFAYSGGQQLADDIGYVPLAKGLLKAARAQINEIVAAPC